MAAKEVKKKGGEMPFTKLNRLYRWKRLLTDQEATCNDVFLDYETFFYSSGIRTRVFPSPQGGFELWVPEKDHDIAKRYAEGTIREIVSEPLGEYRIFNKDLTYKNKRLTQKNRHSTHSKVRKFSMIIMVITIIIMMIMTLALKKYGLL